MGSTPALQGSYLDIGTRRFLLSELEVVWVHAELVTPQSDDWDTLFWVCLGPFRLSDRYSKTADVANQAAVTIAGRLGLPAQEQMKVGDLFGGKRGRRLSPTGSQPRLANPQPRGEFILGDCPQCQNGRTSERARFCGKCGTAFEG